MRTLARLTLPAAALGILLMSCERKMNPIASSLSELDKLPLI